MNVLIVGGGIGGLVTAAALRRVGASVTVLEQAPSFSSVVGAGIVLQANATAVLSALEIPLPPEATRPLGPFAVEGAGGAVLMSSDAAKLGFDPPSVSIHRADLQAALLRAAEGAGAQIRLGCHVQSLHEEGEGGTVRVQDSTGAVGMWDLVVGADGIRSSVRGFLGDKADLRYAGQTCWRFVSPLPPSVGLSGAVERWGTGGRRVGLVPLSGERVYAFLVASAPAGTVGPDSSTLSGLRSRFGEVDPRLSAILDVLGASVPIHHGDLYDQPSVSFGRGRVVLLGDAAHAVTPNMGQGAGLAIEDAAQLALLVSAERGGGDWAERLAEVRRDRVLEVQRTSWRIGQVSHWQWGWSRWLRDGALGALPASWSAEQTRRLWSPGVSLAGSVQSSIFSM